MSNYDTYMRYLVGMEVKPEPQPDYSEPFYIENVSDESGTIAIHQYTTAQTYVTPEYSTDKVNWTTAPHDSSTQIYITVAANSKMYLRCSATVWHFNRITFSRPFNVGGNTLSLLYGSAFDGSQKDLIGAESYAFPNLLQDNTTLLSAEKMLLPARNVFYMCYMGMFKGCTNLTTGPLIEGEEFGNRAATEMFKDCTSLSNIRCLVANISGDHSTYGWVANVAANGTFTKLNGVAFEDGDNGIPTNWRVVNK